MVFPEGLGGARAEGDEALVVAFAAFDVDEAVLEVHVLESEVAKLFSSQAGVE